MQFSKCVIFKDPLMDNATEPEDRLLNQAIKELFLHIMRVKKVAFHFGGENGRTGTVAAGTLLMLGICNSIDEVLEMAKSIRPIIKVNQINEKHWKINLFRNK